MLVSFLKEIRVLADFKFLKNMSIKDSLISIFHSPIICLNYINILSLYWRLNSNKV